MANYAFGQKENGRSVDVPSGAKFTIELKEKPTTGYRWTISTVDEALLATETDKFVPPGQKTPHAGSMRRFFSRQGLRFHCADFDQQMRIGMVTTKPRM